MTNEQIVFEQRMHLMKMGVIGGTGRIYTAKILKDGVETEMQVEEPEPIHTYQAWKEMGYQVKKGEHAIAHFAIWKYREKKDEQTGEKRSSMFLKNASFFKGSQVEKI